MSIMHLIHTTIALSLACIIVKVRRAWECCAMMSVRFCICSRRPWLKLSSLAKWGASSFSNVVGMCGGEGAGNGLLARCCMLSLMVQFGLVAWSSNGHHCCILASMAASIWLIKAKSLHDEGREWVRFLLSSKLMEGEGKGLCWCRSSLSSGRSCG